MGRFAKSSSKNSHQRSPGRLGVGGSNPLAPTKILKYSSRFGRSVYIGPPASFVRDGVVLADSGGFFRVPKTSVAANIMRCRFHNDEGTPISERGSLSQAG